MDRMLPREELSALLDQVTQEITWRESGVRLRLTEPARDGPWEGDCTVYITFERGMDGTLCLCANAAMFVRLAQAVMQTDEFTPQDVTDVAKEYLNVLGGHLLIRLFPTAKQPARFSVPVFCQGSYAPEAQRRYITLNYAGDQAEQVQLAYFTPFRDQTD